MNQRLLYIVGLVALGLGVVAVLDAAQPARAAGATITVSTTQDVLDGNDGLCSLREAIIAANTDAASGLVPGECPAGNGADSISLPAGQYMLTIEGINEDAAATGDLDVLDDLTLQGVQPSSVVIDGNHPATTDRVFDITGTVNLPKVTIANVSIRRGYAPFSAQTSSTSGGGIRNAGILTVTDAILISNGASLNGGAIGNQAVGRLLVSRTVISGNIAGLGWGGIANLGEAAIVDSLVISNTGALINILGGFATIEGSSIISNTGYGYGGGVFSSGALTVANSTISGNRVQGRGGGVYVANGGTLFLDSATVASNSAIFAQSAPSPLGGGIFIEDMAVSVSARDSLIAANTSFGAPSDCHGTLTSGDYNLIETLVNCTVMGVTGHNITGQSAQLAPLRDFTDKMYAHDLRPSSPAIDASNPSSCPLADQRDVLRPLDGNRDGSAICDIGAVEFMPPGIFLPLIRR